MGEKKRLEALWLKFPTTFRQDVGSGYPAEKRKEFRATKDGVFPVKKGDLIIKNPSRIKYGLEEGSGDLIGWTEKIITPDMIGETVAIFTSVEDKSESDRISVEQIIWLLNIQAAGGVAKVFKEGV